MALFARQGSESERRLDNFSKIRITLLSNCLTDAILQNELLVAFYTPAAKYILLWYHKMSANLNVCISILPRIKTIENEPRFVFTIDNSHVKNFYTALTFFDAVPI